MDKRRLPVSIAWRALLFALAWWALSEGRGDAWGIGAAAVLAALWASLRLVPSPPAGFRPARLPGFLLAFFWNSVRGGLQVSLIALRGRRAQRPGLIQLQLHLPPGAPRLFLVGAIGLLPGTLGVRLDGDALRLHVLHEALPAEAEIRSLEALVARLFGAGP